MIIEDKRIEFGKLLKGFREHYLEVSKSVLSKMIQIPRVQLIKLERGDKCFVDINKICFLLDMGFPIHTLKNDYTEREVNDYLRLERFKKYLNHHKNKKLRFHFNMFCEMNKEYIKKNYVSGVLECFGNRGRET
jgi:hypothetical protein